MALTRADCLIWEALLDRGLVPPNPTLLEIGQQNWYGDMPLSWLEAQVVKRHPDPVRMFRDNVDRRDLFHLALAFYWTMLDASDIVAVDLHGDPDGGWISHDLNTPLDLGRQFDIVTNGGTLEHVANQDQALKTIHQHCKVGGLMLHAAPLVGWLDHGFAHMQPGAYFDLAAANEYAVLAFAYFDLRGGKVRLLDGLPALHDLAKAGGLAEGSMFYLVFRKEKDAPYQTPMQGVYSDRRTEEMVRDWHTMR